MLAVATDHATTMGMVKTADPYRLTAWERDTLAAVMLLDGYEGSAFSGLTPREQADVLWQVWQTVTGPRKLHQVWARIKSVK